MPTSKSRPSGGPVLAVLSTALLCASAAAQADGTDASPPEVPVGMRARLDSVVLPGPALIVAPRQRGAPLVLHIVDHYPHGTATRYDFEYYGLEPGQYDLGALLVRADGSAVQALPPVAVTVVPVRPPHEIEPNPLQVERPPAIGGYRTWLVVAGIVWGIGLLAILFAGRRRRKNEAAVAARPRTLADRLRPMVEDAMHGRLDDGGKATLERLLVGYWRERLGLTEAKASAAMAALREHEQAGALVRQLEEWLHRPAPTAPVDINALLEPYRNAPDPEARDSTGAAGAA